MEQLNRLIIESVAQGPREEMLYLNLDHMEIEGMHFLDPGEPGDPDPFAEADEEFIAKKRDELSDEW